MFNIFKNGEIIDFEIEANDIDNEHEALGWYIENELSRYDFFGRLKEDKNGHPYAEVNGNFYSVIKKERLSIKEWENIFRNLQEEGEEVEIMWLDAVPIQNGEPTGEVFEWVLCNGNELFEDGFKTENEAQERLDYLENELL